MTATPSTRNSTWIFSRRRSLADRAGRRVKSGLVLEGGGLRGNYTAGVLDAFLDLGLVFPYVIGVSAGACMGSSYVSRQRGRNLEILKQFHGDWRYVSIRNFLLTRSFFGMDFVFRRIPNEFLPFDYQTFIDSPVRFVSVCTDCKTGQAVYFEKSREQSCEDFLQVLKASSSMPYSSPIAHLKGKPYLDGAVTDAIPLAHTEAEGFKTNVVVLTNPAGYTKEQDPHPPDWLLYFGRKNLRAALKERVPRYNETLAYVEESARAGRCVIIRPSEDLGVSRVEKSKEKLLRLYELGYNDCVKLAPQIK